MTCVIPQEIERQLRERAASRQTTVQQLVEEALSWYLNVEEELLDELGAWHAARDEAARLVEDQLQ